jgi:probable F420-dependent oxidoreductase
MQLGKLGVWASLEAYSAKDGADVAKQIEGLGYAAIWQPEALGRNVLVHSSWILANTTKLIAATGIANIYARDPMSMRAAQLGLAEQSGGRFLLAMGVSHAPMVSGIRGHIYEKPVATMRTYLQRMQAAMYLSPQPPEPPKTLIAALGPKMLELARDGADGAHPYNVTPAHTAQARKILGAGKLLCVEQKVMLETNADVARGVGRKVLATYLSLENYVSNWRREGFTDEDFANGGSDRFIDAMVAWGDENAIKARIREHWSAGADHVCIQTLNREAGDNPLMLNTDLKMLEVLANA